MGREARRENLFCARRCVLLRVRCLIRARCGCPFARWLFPWRRTGRTGREARRKSVFRAAARVSVCALAFSLEGEEARCKSVRAALCSAADALFDVGAARVSVCALAFSLEEDRPGGPGGTA